MSFGYRFHRSLYQKNIKDKLFGGMWQVLLSFSPNVHSIDCFDLTLKWSIMGALILKAIVGGVQPYDGKTKTYTGAYC